MNLIPSEITIGDDILWVFRNVQAITGIDGNDEEYTDIKASDGWSLNFTAVGKNGIIKITAIADDDNADDFKFSAVSSTTDDYIAGDYQYQITATKLSNRYSITKGWITLEDNIAGRSALYDNRSHAKKVLDAIEAVIESRATSNDLSVAINGREIRYIPFEELMRLRSLYKDEYETEQARSDMEAGRPTGRKILTMFK